jgi:hypothetical protein
MATSPKNFHLPEAAVFLRGKKALLGKLLFFFSIFGAAKIMQPIRN